MSAPAIEARGLERRFGQIRAVRGVDLTLERGETLTLFGPNGAGKTTLLRMLGLGIRPHGGTLRVDGLDPAREARRARARIGWLAHGSSIYGELTPLDNLVFWGALYGVAEPRRRAEELLVEYGLERWAEEPAKALSRGLTQRLALARALVHEPPLLLLDEPFTGLDATAEARLEQRLADKRDGYRSTLLTTHRVDLGLALSDRWVRLARGRVVESGRSRETDAAELRARLRESGAAR